MHEKSEFERKKDLSDWYGTSAFSEKSILQEIQECEIVIGRRCNNKKPP